MVSIITATMRPEFMKNIFRNYKRQRYKKKELIIILNRDNMDINYWRNQASQYKNISVYQVPEIYKLGKCLNYGIKKAKHKVIAKFDDDDYYSPYYLTESMNALRKRKAPVVGKYTTYIYFEGKKALMLYRLKGERKFRRFLKGGTLVFRKYVWKHVKFNEKKLHGSDVAFIRGCRRRGYKCYSVSKYNYVCVRRKDTSSHTQKTSTKKYMARCKLVKRTSKYTRIITKKIK